MNVIHMCAYTVWMKSSHDLLENIHGSDGFMPEYRMYFNKILKQA